MSFYEDDFYDEPSEFEIQIEEFKKGLAKSVKEEFLSEMEQLRKENAELQEIKKNFDSIKNDYRRKEQQLEYERSNLKSEVRRERLGELLKDHEVELFTVASRSKSKPKCDKCDDRRRIRYKTPLGRDASEACECDLKIAVYEPIPILLSSFSIRNGKGNAWYKVKTDKYDDWLSYYDDSISGDALITDEAQFEDIGYVYKTLFANREIAQKYCDYKNSKEV